MAQRKSDLPRNSVLLKQLIRTGGAIKRVAISRSGANGFWNTRMAASAQVPDLKSQAPETVSLVRLGTEVRLIVGCGSDATNPAGSHVLPLCSMGIFSLPLNNRYRQRNGDCTLMRIGAVHERRSCALQLRAGKEAPRKFPQLWLTPRCEQCECSLGTEHTTTENEFSLRPDPTLLD
jgi:hypothetical protein